MIIELGELS